MKTVKIDKIIQDSGLLQEFVSDMKEGAVAVIPTDTVYGFAAASNVQSAVQRIYQIKRRDFNKPLILFLHSYTEVNKIGFSVPEHAEKAIEKYWPGALTAIFKTIESPMLSAFSFPSIGLRVPAHKSLLKLLESIPLKFLTTSANRSGEDTPSDPKIIADEFSGEVDWLIDGGILNSSVPSTVVDFSVNPYKVLRQGNVIL